MNQILLEQFETFKPLYCYAVTTKRFGTFELLFPCQVLLQAFFRVPVSRATNQNAVESELDGN